MEDKKDLLLRGSVTLDLEHCLDPNLDEAYIDDAMIHQHTAIFHVMKLALDEAQNLALVEIDGLYQLLRIDQKEFLGVAPEYFLN